MPRRTDMAFVLALAVGSLAPRPAAATVFLPRAEQVRFEIEGWSIVCGGLIADMDACSATQKLDSAELTMFVDKERGRIDLEGSCADRKKKRTGAIPFPLEASDGKIPDLLDTMFLEAFEDCDSPASWPLLQSAQRVARILYKITR